VTMHPPRATSRAVRAITLVTVGSNLDPPLQNPSHRETQHHTRPENTRPQPLAIPVTVGSPSHGIARSTTPMPTEPLKQKACESESREAARRGGMARSSEEVSDKEMEPRGRVQGGWFGASTGNGRNP
jgi:hypothetical protein